MSAASELERREHEILERFGGSLETERQGEWQRAIAYFMMRVEIPDAQLDLYDDGEELSEAAPVVSRLGLSDQSWFGQADRGPLERRSPLNQASCGGEEPSSSILDLTLCRPLLKLM